VTLTTSTVLRRVDDVRFRAVGDETVVIRQEAAEALVLNEVAGRLLDLIDGKRTIADLVDRLLEEYEVAPGDVVGDVKEYLEELVETGIVTLT